MKRAFFYLFGPWLFVWQSLFAGSMPTGWNPALAGDEVMARLVRVTAPQVKGAHDAEFVCVGERAYIVEHDNDVKPGHSAGAAQYCVLSVVNLKSLAVEKIVPLAKSEQVFENATLPAGMCFVPRILKANESTLRCYFTSQPAKEQALTWYRDFDLRSLSFENRIHKAKLKTAAGVFDMEPRHFHADAAAQGFAKPAQNYGLYILDSFKEFDGKRYVAINNFPGKQNALALLHDDLVTFEVIGHYNEPQSQQLSESAVNRLPDGTWMAICRNDLGNYHFTTSQDGRTWTAGKPLPFVPNGTNSKPTFNRFGDIYYLGWQEAASIQGGRRSVFNVDISREGKTWERKYRFESPDSFQYPTFHEHGGVIWVSVTQGAKGSTDRILFGKLEETGQFAPQTGQARKPPSPSTSPSMEPGAEHPNQGAEFKPTLPIARLLDLSRRQLVLDDAVVARTSGVEKIYHAAKTVEGRLVKCETPAERDRRWIDRPSVIRDEQTGMFKMWYQVWTEEKAIDLRWLTLFATSKDGLTWTKPRIGTKEFRGDGKSNNIVYPDWLRTVVPDPKGKGFLALVVRPEQLVQLDATGTRVVKTKAVTSIQRRHITGFADLQKVQPKAISDEARMMWDPLSQRFFGTFKTGKPVPDSVKPDRYRRAVAFAWSKDAVHWEFTSHLFTADKDDDAYLSKLDYVKPDQPAWLELDDMPVYRYEGLIMGMMSCMYMYNGEGGGLNGEVFLAWSRDGNEWHRPQPRAPFIAGPKGSFMYGDFRAATTPPIRMGDELWFYHGVGGDQRNVNHRVYHPDGMGIALSKLRVDGFASLKAGAPEALVETAPFLISETPLRVNGDFSHGRCIVELVGNREGGPVLCASDPLTSNGIALEVRWKGKLPEASRGKEGFLRFRFSNGELYSFYQ